MAVASKVSWVERAAVSMTLPRVDPPSSSHVHSSAVPYASQTESVSLPSDPVSTTHAETAAGIHRCTVNNSNRSRSSSRVKQKRSANAKENARQRCMCEGPVRTKSKLTMMFHLDSTADDT